MFTTVYACDNVEAELLSRINMKCGGEVACKTV